MSSKGTAIYVILEDNPKAVKRNLDNNFLKFKESITFRSGEHSFEMGYSLNYSDLASHMFISEFGLSIEDYVKYRLIKKPRDCGKKYSKRKFPELK